MWGGSGGGGWGWRGATIAGGDPVVVLKEMSLPVRALEATCSMADSAVESKLTGKTGRSANLIDNSGFLFTEGSLPIQVQEPFWFIQVANMDTVV